MLKNETTHWINHNWKFERKKIDNDSKIFIKCFSKHIHAKTITYLNYRPLIGLELELIWTHCTTRNLMNSAVSLESHLYLEKRLPRRPLFAVSLRIQRRQNGQNQDLGLAVILLKNDQRNNEAQCVGQEWAYCQIQWPVQENNARNPNFQLLKSCWFVHAKIILKNQCCILCRHEIWDEIWATVKLLKQWHHVEDVVTIMMFYMFLNFWEESKKFAMLLNNCNQL